mmetsp:Transcript_7096/g.29307  ORF Transcript_7096/g.29307 Transcript_7096/m.29307 type:complete len:228 (+) Transcript_7096:2682-3365(+)
MAMIAYMPSDVVRGRFSANDVCRRGVEVGRRRRRDRTRSSGGAGFDVKRVIRGFVFPSDRLPPLAVFDVLEREHRLGVRFLCVLCVYIRGVDLVPVVVEKAFVVPGRRPLLLHLRDPPVFGGGHGIAVAVDDATALVPVELAEGSLLVRAAAAGSRVAARGRARQGERRARGAGAAASDAAAPAESARDRRRMRRGRGARDRRGGGHRAEKRGGGRRARRRECTGPV